MARRDWAVWYKTPSSTKWAVLDRHYSRQHAELELARNMRRFRQWEFKIDGPSNKKAETTTGV